MDTITLISLIITILVNASIIVAAWVRVKTDIASMKVEIFHIDSRLKDEEQKNSSTIRDIKIEFEKFRESNEEKHDIINNKVDVIKDGINDIKIIIAKLH